jgi:recombination protein RecT
VGAQDEANRTAGRRQGGTAMEQANRSAGTAAAKSGHQAANAVEALTSMLDNPKIQVGLMQMVPEALKRTLTPERILRIATGNVKGNAYLAKCTPGSVIGAISKAASLGLVPDGLLGHAYLVPRRMGNVWHANFQLGYKGFVLLVYRSTGIVMTARVVYRDEPFLHREGLSPILEHEPDLDNDGDEDPSHVRAAYSTAQFPNKHQRSFRVMGINRILKVRNEADAYKRRKNDNTPWVNHFVAMAEKTVLRRHCSQLPLSAEAMGAIREDESKDAMGVGQVHIMTKDGEIDISDMQSPEPLQLDPAASVDGPEVVAGEVTPEVVPEVSEPPESGQEPEPASEGTGETDLTPAGLLAAFQAAYGVEVLLLEEHVAGKDQPPLPMEEWTQEDVEKLNDLNRDLAGTAKNKLQAKLKKAFRVVRCWF